MRRGTTLTAALTGAITSIALALSAGAQSPPAMPPSPTRARTISDDLQLFTQVFSQIRANHADSVDSHQLLMAAVTGMLRAADPHSFVIPAVRLSLELEALRREGKLAPVPVAFTYVDGAPFLISVAPDSKAAQQDLVVGDELLAVDGAKVSAASAEELEQTLLGAKGSSVTLTLARRRGDGSSTRLERRVLRQHVDETSAVPVAIMFDSITGYVRVTTFLSEKVADDLHAALGQLERKGMKRLVLDLRDNGGGIVQQAAQVAAEFLPTGALVATSLGRKEGVDTARVKRSFWRAERRFPVVVMINQGTASASELVAGALQDHDRALIVGTPSFGKALVMRGFPLTDGSILMLVVGQMKTPCGRVIQRPYRSISTRDYFRRAGAVIDTTGRPSCKTDAGRLVYGGGGIYPDLMLRTDRTIPDWLARLNEADTWVEWLGSYFEDQGKRLPTLEAFIEADFVTPASVALLRTIATRKGIELPPDTDPTLRLQMRSRIAGAKWGSAAALTIEARTDAQLSEAMKGFSRASELLGPAR